MAQGGRRMSPASFNPSDGRFWNHVYRYPSPRLITVDELCTLLREVLTLVPVPELDTILALDFYKRPDPAVPQVEWQNTTAGGLCNRLKFWKGDPAAQAEAAFELVHRLSRAIGRHPLYNVAELLVVVPSTRSGVSESLGQEVATELRRPYQIARETTGAAWQAKAGTDGQPPRHYTVTGGVAGRSVIVIDDVYRSGSSMRGVGAACRRAGATRVLGLVAARTLRRV